MNEALYNDLQARLEGVKSALGEGAIAWHQPDYARRGFHLDVQVNAEKIVELAQVMNDLKLVLDMVSAVDWPDAEQLEIVYDFFDFNRLLRVTVRTRIDRKEPVIDTISKVFPGADWHEREAFDFFGIQFRSHPNLVRILLPEDADFHPLRKDYSA